MPLLLPDDRLEAKLTYGRSIRACTRYPLTKQRCRTARG
jgi:hypothetical protein